VDPFGGLGGISSPTVAPLTRGSPWVIQVSSQAKSNLTASVLDALQKAVRCDEIVTVFAHSNYYTKLYPAIPSYITVLYLGTSVLDTDNSQVQS
jgi:hypothetical protein